MHKTYCLVQYLNSTLLDKGPCSSGEKSSLGEFRIREFDFETIYRDSLFHSDRISTK